MQNNEEVMYQVYEKCEIQIECQTIAKRDRNIGLQCLTLKKIRRE